MNDVPEHVAVIMDGNGRWAREKGLSRIEGHKAGVKTVREIVRTSREIGIRYLTLYAFSSENWKRPRTEIHALMNLLKKFLVEEIDEMNQNGIRMNAIGRLKELPNGVQKRLKEAMRVTSQNSQMMLILALNYGSRAEVLEALKDIIKDCEKGVVSKKALNEEIIGNYLYTKGIPDPDLLIRTSGEKRLSNFLLWQLSYSELWFTSTSWPDFNKEEFLKAINSFKVRERRFGGVK